MAFMDGETICFKCEDNDTSFKVKCCNDGNGIICHAVYHEKCLVLAPSFTSSSPDLAPENTVLCTWYCINCNHCNTLSVSFAFLMNNQLINSLEKLNNNLVQGFEQINKEVVSGFSDLGNKLNQDIDQLGNDLSQELEQLREKLSVDVQQLNSDMDYNLKQLNDGIIGLQSTVESYLDKKE